MNLSDENFDEESEQDQTGSNTNVWGDSGSTGTPEHELAGERRGKSKLPLIIITAVFAVLGIIVYMKLSGGESSTKDVKPVTPPVVNKNSQTSNTPKVSVAVKQNSEAQKPNTSNSAVVTYSSKVKEGNILDTIEGVSEDQQQPSSGLYARTVRARTDDIWHVVGRLEIDGHVFTNYMIAREAKIDPFFVQYDLGNKYSKLVCGVITDGKYPVRLQLYDKQRSSNFVDTVVPAGTLYQITIDVSQMGLISMGVLTPDGKTEFKQNTYIIPLKLYPK